MQKHWAPDQLSNERSECSSGPGPEGVDYIKWTPPVLSQNRFQGIPFHRSAVDGVYGRTEEIIL